MKRFYFLLILSCFTQLTFGQTIWSEGFESGLSQWTVIDGDGDGLSWGIGSAPGIVVASGNSCAISYSWTNNTGPLTPNNYMISPVVDLTNETGGLVLEWQAYGQDQNFADEHYQVVVSSGNTQADVDAGTVVYDGIVGANGGYVTFAADLSSFAGQSIYIAFVHNDVMDEFALNIDDVSVFLNQNGANEVAATGFASDGFQIIGTNVAISATYQNLGTDPITELTASYTVNGGAPVSETFTGLNVAFNNSGVITFSEGVALAQDVLNVSVTIESVNGTTDNTDDNTTTGTIIPMTDIPSRAFVVEEGTGTWCGWCPRGAVGLDHITSTYDDAIGIAVHNSDPMDIGSYDTDLITLVDGGGYPFSGINRTFETDPNSNALENAYESERTKIVPATLSAEAVMDPDRQLTVDVTANIFAAQMQGNYRINVILTEDDVTGTSSGYAQVNYYSGGDFGAMSGYENLPDPVPAADMVYNHVARMLMGGFNGDEGSFPATATSNDSPTYQYIAEIPEAWNADNMHAVAILLDMDNGGQIVNAVSTSIESLVSSTSDLFQNDLVDIYPNPFSDVTNIALTLEEAKTVDLEVYDAVGQLVMVRDYGRLSGEMILPLNATNLNTGMYFVHLRVGAKLVTKKINVLK